MNESYQKFYNELRLRGKSPRTIEIYMQHLTKLEKYYHKTPDLVNENKVREYLLYMKDVKNYSETFFKQALSSFRYYYERTMAKEWKTLEFTYPKKEKKLPDVLSIKEVRLILSHIRLPRYYALLSTLYSLGLRISEGGIHCPDNKEHMPLSSIQIVLQEVVKEVGIKKWVHPQTLRHSYATHLLEGRS